MERYSMMAGTNRAIVGEPAPRFECQAVIDGRIRELSLQSILKNHQWTLLIFYPMAWSFVCPTEIIAFNNAIADFSARGCAVLFISTDNEYVLRAWNSMDKEEGGLGQVHVPLLSDRSHRVTRDYGVLIEEEGIARRASFFIDPAGIIRGTTVNDSNVGRSVAEAKRTLDALKFTDEFGEACPVDWKSGEQGLMLPSPPARSTSNGTGVAHQHHNHHHQFKLSLGGSSDSDAKEAARETLTRETSTHSIVQMPTATPHTMSPGPVQTPTTPTGRPGISRGLSWANNWMRSPASSKPSSPVEGTFRPTEVRPRSLLFEEESITENGPQIAAH